MNKLKIFDLLKIFWGFDKNIYEPVENIYEPIENIYEPVENILRP